MNNEELILSRLASLISSLHATALPQPVLEKTRSLMLDTIGCAVAGRAHPAVAKAAQAAAAIFPGAQALGLGSGVQRGVLGALLDSGAAIRALDLNDFYWGPGVGGHPSDLFATVFALAQTHGATLGQALEAAVVGYDVYLRVVDLLPDSGAFDHTTAMTLGSAAIAARLLKLSARQTADALSLAAVRGPALAAMRYGQISEAKAIAPASAAISGVVAAQLAAAGIGGPGDSLQGMRGMGALLREGIALDTMASPSRFGERILEVGIKRYPCIGTAQAAVACAVHLREKLAGRQPSSIAVRLADDQIIHHQTTGAYRRPDRRETADHSFFSLMSMALVDGDVTPAQFDRGRFLDEDVLAMGERLHFTCDLPGAKSARLPAQATAKLADGNTVHASVDYAPGHPLNPLDEAGLSGKFNMCVAGRLSSAVAARMVADCLSAPLSTPVAAIIAPLETA